MKLFQYDKKVWENGETSHTWQFGILKNRSFLWVNYENPTNHHYSSPNSTSSNNFFRLFI